ncbi:MAG: hypothetical protein DRJ97_02715 [Thermoprotei archaeon]|nr:MAG: hypothetical protein DRJ97_02715 [Thermoprotei archaeon]
MLKVEELLMSKGVPYRLIKLRRRALSVDDVVRYAEEEVNEDEVCKTVVLKGETSGKVYAVLLPGRLKVDLEAVSYFVGEEVKVAPIKELKRLGGEPGALCPLTIDAELLVDDEVFKRRRINFSSGDPHYGLEVSPADLAKLISFKHGRFSLKS